MATYPAESFYRSQIRQKIDPTTSVPIVLKVKKTPTLSSWLITLSPDTVNEEIAEYSSKDDVNGTITLSKRWINPSSQVLTTSWTDYNNPTYQKTHASNNSIRCDVTHLHIIQDYWNLSTNKLDKSWGLRDTMGTAQDIWATNWSTAITVTDTTGWTNGATITWTWIPWGTTIVSFVPNISAVLSAAFTGTTWTVSVIVGRRQVIEIDTSNNEVKKVISDGTTISSSETIRKRKSDGTYEEITFSVFQSALSPSAVVDQQYYAWESLTSWDSVFAEGTPTFASATTVLNISDVTANTRIFFPIFGSGVAMTTFKLALRKAGTPTQNLNFRIETDNGSGLPSGTLFNANGTATIAQWSLTTSFADTTLTLAWSITIPAAQLCHIVMFQGTYWTETINNTNYYQVGTSTSHSNSRNFWKHNGTSYSTNFTTQWFWNSWSSAWTWTFCDTIVTISKPTNITSVLKRAWATAWTTCTITQWGVSQATSFVTDTATFSTPVFLYPWTATIRLSAWSSLAIQLASVQATTASSFSASQTNGIEYINGQEIYTIPYVSSSGVLSTVISKTSARVSYKIGSYPSFATQAIARWSIAVRAILGEIAISWVVDNTLYYISDIDGGISTSAWVNSSKAGKWFGTQLFIDKYAA